MIRKRSRNNLPAWGIDWKRCLLICYAEAEVCLQNYFLAVLKHLNWEPSWVSPQYCSIGHDWWLCGKYESAMATGKNLLLLFRKNKMYQLECKMKKKDLFSLTEARHKSRHLLLILEQSPKRQWREGTDCLVFRSAIKTFSALETAKSLGCCI